MRKAILFILSWTFSHALFAQWTNSGNNTYFSNTGYLGIGTTTPASKLNVVDLANYSASGGASTGVLTVVNNYAGTGSNMALFASPNSSANAQFAFFVPALNVAGIQAQLSSTGAATGLAINPLGGNVGVGISNPANKLEIVQVNTFNAADPTTYAVDLAQSGCNLGIGGNSSGSVLQSFNSLPLMLNPKGNNVVINGSSTSNVLIGETSQVNTSYRLDVNGTVRATGITVNTTGADFVFDSTYQLRAIEDLKAFVATNHHLPGLAPAAEMRSSGADLGELTTKLLQKVEELTLYTIQLQEELKAQKDELNKLKSQNGKQ